MIRQERSKRWSQRLPPLALVLLMTGCSLFRGPPPETFELVGPSSVPTTSGTAAQILIPEPSALKTLDSERIVVATGPRLSYYPDAQWPDRMPKVYQAKAIEAFEKSKKAKAVGRPGEGLSIDYQLLTNIRSFEYRTDGAGGGFAHIEVTAKIMDDRNGRIVAVRTLTGDAAVHEDSAEGVVAGVDAALSQVLIELVRWTLGVI
ncbi:cholesterol transport system auxiliary component [Bauldia litoralis]|uniref:Cholesterol transport system auxiliary component n=2 Tax=Bauldia litoralis TaxID=665467 RepID=A0A1G6D878_9HYPH|nr:cholesterol transport system auxiliary component [Bauldia litoralis]